MGMILAMAFLDMLGVASILPFMAVLANPELVQTNDMLNRAFAVSRHIGIHSPEQFLFALGVLVFMLLVTSLASRRSPPTRKPASRTCASTALASAWWKAICTSLTAGF